MTSHQTKVLLALLVAAALLAVISYVIVSRRTAPEAVAPSDAAESAIESLSESSTVDVPSANPLDAVPNVNPIERANPFSNVYENPFE